MRRRSPVVAAGVAAWLLAGAAMGQAPGGEVSFERGRALRAEHRDEEALAVFQRLYEATHEPRALAQVALAEGALGRWVAAEAHLDAALAAPDAWTTRHRGLLTTARQEIATHVGELLIECSTPGSELWIDGQRVAALPLPRPLRAVAGTAAVEVRAPGFITVSRSVTVPGGGLAREPVTLAAVPPVPVVVTPPAPVVVAPPPPVVVVTPPPRRVTPPPSSGRRTWAVATAVGAGIFGATAVALYSVGAGRIGEYNEDPSCPGEQETSVPRSDTCQGHLDAAYGLRAGAIVSLVFAVGSAVASTVLFTTTPRERQSPRVACGGGPGTVGVACTVAF